MTAKRRQQIKREGYQNWCLDCLPTYKYGRKILLDGYDRSCYEEGHHKAQEEYDSEERRIAKHKEDTESPDGGELYSILAAHFRYCEEDSWEQQQDLEEWSYNEMFEYYIKYL
jgi:hypothetical protein